MNSPLANFTADHRTLLAAAAEAAGFADPIAFDPESLLYTLVGNAVRGRFVPLHGAFIRDWDTHGRRYWPGMQYGLRVYTLRGVTFVRAVLGEAANQPTAGYDVFVVDRKDYLKLYRIGLQLSRERTPAEPPVMTAAHRDTLWRNTVDFLAPDNLKRITGYGGRAKRGLLLTGPPGNGKTSACRWIRSEAAQRGWVAKSVTPDDYQAARRSCSPAAAVRELFDAGGRGVVFFDDLDIALRDRDAVKETDDQAVFLSALDGITVTEGVVYVFTTNCPVDLIDPAFRRPGRIDLTLHFPKPDADLRRQLVSRWHLELRTAVGVETVVANTAGMSFAEIDELKNLLVLRFLDSNEWDWAWAQEQFRENRDGLANRRADRTVGFAVSANGKH
jgi:cell division protease FtsH